VYVCVGANSHNRQPTLSLAAAIAYPSRCKLRHEIIGRAFVQPLCGSACIETTVSKARLLYQEVLCRTAVLEVRILEPDEEFQGGAERLAAVHSNIIVATAKRNLVNCKERGKGGADMATASYLRSRFRMVVSVPMVGQISLLPPAPNWLSLHSREDYFQQTAG
jgi:hypothetical protein